LRDVTDHKTILMLHVLLPC